MQESPAPPPKLKPKTLAWPAEPKTWQIKIKSSSLRSPEKVFCSDQLLPPLPAPPLQSQADQLPRLNPLSPDNTGIGQPANRPANQSQDRQLPGQNNNPAKLLIGPRLGAAFTKTRGATDLDTKKTNPK